MLQGGGVTRWLQGVKWVLCATMRWMCGGGSVVGEGVNEVATRGAIENQLK